MYELLRVAQARVLTPSSLQVGKASGGAPASPRLLPCLTASSAGPDRTPKSPYPHLSIRGSAVDFSKPLENGFEEDVLARDAVVGGQVLEHDGAALPVQVQDHADRHLPHLQHPVLQGAHCELNGEAGPASPREQRERRALRALR